MYRGLTYFFLLLGFCTGFSWYAAAQEEADILRYSMQMPQSTARSIGFGSAVGALGGDFTSTSVNPAGLGVYRSGELTFTPSVKLAGTNSTYTGPSTADNFTQFTFNNVGLVLNATAKGKNYEKSNWKSVSFAIGFNRLADFNNSYNYSGYNDSSSGSEVFLIDAINFPNDINNISTNAGLGYETYLINDDPQFGFYKAPDHSAGLNQQRIVSERGGLTEVNFSFGGNYMEKLMLGATIGIPSIRYVRETTFIEEDASGDIDNDFDFFEYNENVRTTGTGINLKLGFIYNITQSFRAGLAFHTPSFIGMRDLQDRSLVANTENLKADLFNDFSGPLTRVEVPTNEFQYSMVTPWRGVVSAAGIIGKMGFISMDYEFVDYSSMRYNFDGAFINYETEVNNNIKNLYTAASNLRLGGELRLDDLMLRLGFGYYGNPYQDAAMGSETIQISAGAGMRFDNIFLDLGFAHSQREFTEQPYTLTYPQPIGSIPVYDANVKSSMNNVALTLGFKF